MPSTYPSQADAEALLTSVGISFPTGAWKDIYIQSAIDEWEEGTRELPFLAGDEPEEFLYDPPGPNQRGEWRGGGKILNLNRGFVSISEVRVNISYGTLAYAGDVLVEGDDYRLAPYNAPLDGRPYRKIEFVSTRFGGPKSIQITGIRGYCTELKSVVWDAIRSLAAAKYAAALLEAIFAVGATNYKEGDETVTVDTDLLRKFGSVWRREARDAMQIYIRIL